MFTLKHEALAKKKGFPRSQFSPFHLVIVLGFVKKILPLSEFSINIKFHVDVFTDCQRGGWRKTRKVWNFVLARSN
jgi:hypothetical protein